MAKFRFADYTDTLTISNKQLGVIAAIGAAVGVLTWLVSLLFSQIIIEPLFCQSADSFSACANGGTLATVLAMIVVHIAGLFVLIRAGVYRPLLVVLASLVTLYGLNIWAGVLSWFEAALWYGLLTAITYVLFAWIAHLKSFLSALVIMTVVIVLIRTVITEL